MNISIEQIMNNLSPAYRIRLVAGKKGIYNHEINWVTIVEDYSVEKFKHINQIILTSGLNYKNEEELLEYVKCLKEVQVSAIIINIGKYIKEVPKSIVEYCNETDIPLYTMPWDVLMSDENIVHMHNETYIAKWYNIF